MYASSLLLLGLARASTPAEAQAAGAEMVQPEPAPPPRPFRAVVLLQGRATVSNINTTVPYLDGQVVGSLGGLNGTTVPGPEGLDLDGDGEPDEDLGRSTYTEQRASAFFDWAPDVLDGRAKLSSAFEIDFLWGDRSYGSGGNTGGGIGGDQVNLQTRRLYTTFALDRRPSHKLDLLTGLQFVADGAQNPHTARMDDLLRAGGGLRFFGTEAAGLSLYGRVADASGERLRYRAGAYKLVEQGVGVDDDATLYMADLDGLPQHNMHGALHFWLLRDDANGTGSSFGTGPMSQLSQLQGGPSLDPDGPNDATVRKIDADIAWVGGDAGYNHRLDAGRFGATGLFVYNLGRIYVEELPDISIRGWTVDGELRYRWGAGSGSVLRAGGLLASRDGTGASAYTGVITANSYGVAGALWGNHGALLLLPDPGAINRLTPVVADISAGGVGLRAAHGAAGWAIVPEKLDLVLGGAWAQDGLGEAFGTELNGRLTWTPLLFTHVGLAAATVQGSRFEANPGLVMLQADWLAF